MSLTRSLLVSVSMIGLSFAAFAQNPPAAPAPAPAIAVAPTPAAPAANAVTRQELPALVKEVLMNDPDIIMQAVQKLRDKKAAEAKQKTAEAIVKYQAELTSEDSPSVGDSKTADVTIVEFFDYHCGYCRHMLPDITKLLNEDKKVRFVFREFPILSEDSVAAARAALAVNRLDKTKYFDFHSAMMKQEGKFDDKAFAAIAKKIGISADKLKAEMAKPEITAILDKNREIGEAIGVSGTPALVIGSEFTPGAMSYDDMKKAVAAAREKKGGAAAAPTPAAPAAPEAPKPAIGEGKPAAKPVAPAAPAPAAVPAVALPTAPAAPAPAAPTPPAPPKH